MASTSAPQQFNAEEADNLEDVRTKPFLKLAYIGMSLTLSLD